MSEPEIVNVATRFGVGEYWYACRNMDCAVDISVAVDGTEEAARERWDEAMEKIIQNASNISAREDEQNDLVENEPIDAWAEYKQQKLEADIREWERLQPLR
jgi:hypothetical protein